MGQPLSVVRNSAYHILTTLAYLEEAYPSTKTLQFRVSVGFFLGPPLIATACKYLAIATKDTAVDATNQQPSPPNPPAPKTAAASRDAQTQTDEVAHKPLATSATTTAEAFGEQDFLTVPPSAAPADAIHEANSHVNTADDEPLDMSAADVSDTDDEPLNMSAVDVSDTDDEPLNMSAADVSDNNDGKIDQSLPQVSLQEEIDSSRNKTAALVANLHATVERLNEQLNEQTKKVADTQLELSKTAQNDPLSGLKMSDSRMKRREEEKRRNFEARASSAEQPKVTGEQHIDREGVTTTTTNAEIKAEAVEHDHAKEHASSGECNEDENSDLDEVPLALQMAEPFPRRLPVSNTTNLRKTFQLMEYKQWLKEEQAGRKADAEKAKAAAEKAKADAEKAESEIAESKLQWSTEKDDLVARHQTEMGEMTASHRVATDNLKKALQTLEAKVDELTKDQLEKSEEVKNLQVKLNDMERSSESMRKEMTLREDEAQRKEQQMSAQYKALEDKHNEELTTKQDRLESQQQSISDLQTNATSQTAAVEELRNSNATKDKENRALKAENKALKSQNARWKSQFVNFKRSSKNDAAEKDAEIKKLEADNETAQREILRLICCFPLPGSTRSSAFGRKPSLPSSNESLLLDHSSTSGSSMTKASATGFLGSLLDTDVPLEFSSSEIFPATPGKSTQSVEHGAIGSTVDEPIVIPSSPLLVPEAEPQPQHGDMKTAGPPALSSIVGKNVVAENTNEVPEQLQQPSSTPTDVVTFPLKQTIPTTDSSENPTLEVPKDVANDSTPQASYRLPTQVLAESDTTVEVSKDNTSARDGNVPNILENKPQKERPSTPADVATLPLNQTISTGDSSKNPTLEVPKDAANDSTPQASSDFLSQAWAKLNINTEAPKDHTLASDSNVPNIPDKEPQKE
ncbi:MAG: hypothetical protein Q9200_003447 [Gallowayella weberi]